MSTKAAKKIVQQLMEGKELRDILGVAPPPTKRSLEVIDPGIEALFAPPPPPPRWRAARDAMDQRLTDKTMAKMGETLRRQAEERRVQEFRAAVARAAAQKRTAANPVIPDPAVLPSGFDDIDF